MACRKPMLMAKLGSPHGGDKHVDGTQTTTYYTRRGMVLMFCHPDLLENRDRHYHGVNEQQFEAFRRADQHKKLLDGKHTQGVVAPSEKGYKHME